MSLAQKVLSHPTARFAQQVIQQQSLQRTSLTAAGIAFWFVIALFPALIATMMVLGLILSPEQLQATINELQKASPDSFGGFVLTQVQQATRARPTTLSLGFAVSLVVVLWSTSGGFYNFTRGARLAYDLPPHPYLRARGRALVGAVIGILLFGLLAVLAASSLALGGSLTGVLRWLAWVVGALVGMAILAAILAALYFLATGRQHPRPHYAPGSVFGSIAVVAVTGGFTAYLGFSSSYESVYGALAGAIILLLVVYFCCYMVLLGALINANWDRFRDDVKTSRQ